MIQKKISLARRLLGRVLPPPFAVEVKGPAHRGPGGWGLLRLITPKGVRSGKLSRLKPCGKNCVRLKLPQREVPPGRYQLDMVVFCCPKGIGQVIGTFEVELNRSEDGIGIVNLRQRKEGNQP